MRLRDPIPPGHTRRIGAAAAASVVLHATVGAVLTGAALSIAVEAAQLTATGDIMMSAAAAPSPDLFRSATPTTPQRPLDSLLTPSKAVGAGPARVEAEPAGNANLAEVLAQADAAAKTEGAATTSASGAAAALERTPGTAGVAFAGLAAHGEQARTVVYVIDASGPMISSLSDVFAEVNRSVGSLLPTQRFGVVLFRDDGGGGTAVFDSQLREANPRNREQLKRWMASVTASGRSNPMDGLRTALAFKPQVIFLLSRSITRTGGNVWDVGPDAILAELERLNPPIAGAPGKGRATLIKTIQFQEPDATGVMQRIAERHGGPAKSAEGPAYRVMKREELQKR